MVIYDTSCFLTMLSSLTPILTPKVIDQKLISTNYAACKLFSYVLYTCHKEIYVTVKYIPYLFIIKP